MATALFGSGIFGTDTFGAPTGASFTALSQAATIKESDSETLLTSGNIINPDVLTTLLTSGTLKGRGGDWDEGTFDNNVFQDTESSFSTLAVSGAFTSSSFSFLETSIGEIRVPGTIFDFRTPLEMEGTIVGTEFRITTLRVTAHFAEKHRDRTRLSDATLYQAGLHARGKWRRQNIHNRSW